MEFMSESSTDGKSFGLLDENLLQDISTLHSNKKNNTELNNRNKFSKVKEKPPIPDAKRKQLVSEGLRHQSDLMMLDQNGDPAEETVASIRLNESDLKDLESEEFTFDEDDDEEKSNEHEHTLNNNEPNGKQIVNMFDSLQIKNDLYRNEMLLNESADILRNSNEFIQNKNVINYDGMDEINNMNAGDETKQLANQTTNMTINSMTEYANTTNNQNTPISYANYQMSDRISKIVSQSLEKFKRNTCTTTDILDQSYSNLITSKNQYGGRRFSASTVRTQCSNMNDLSNVTHLENSLASDTINQSISFSANLENLKHVDPLENRQDNQSVMSMSKYFKPAANEYDDVNATTSQQFTNCDFLTMANQHANNQTDEMFHRMSDVNQLTSESMFEGCSKPADFFGKQAGNQEFMHVNEDEFKSGSEFLTDLKDDEMQNRKEFATNELTVLAGKEDENNETSSGSDTSVSTSRPKQDKWWKKAEVSKLEQSKAQDYFEGNSSFPSYLLNKDPDTSYSMLKSLKSSSTILNAPEKETNSNTLSSSLLAVLSEKHDKHEHDVTLINDDHDKNPTHEADQSYRQANSNDSADITLSTTKNQASSDNITNNFSFTFNTSENGEFIVKKVVNNESTKAASIASSTSPFQLTNMLNSYPTKKSTTSLLETIGEDLNRVSSRLALSKKNDSISKTTTITAITTTTTTTKAAATADLSNEKSLRQNNQLILTMDETISSINSSSNRTTNLIKQQHSKQKVVTGSLTSTPSKLKKNEKSLRKPDQNEQMTSTNNPLLGQDSFMSSIPERTNDSTLVGNHHHFYAANKKTNVCKNAEIQTSPDKSTSSSSSSTASSFSTCSADVPLLNKAVVDKTQSTSSNVSSQMLAVNLASSLLSNNNETNSNRTSLFNNSNNGLIPVALLTADAVFPFMQKIYESNQLQQKSQIDLSSNSISSLNQRPPSGLFASMNSAGSNDSQCSSSNKYKFELPQLEFDKPSVDFGQIAEGCYETSRMFVKLANSSLIQHNREHNIISYLQVEMDQNWHIESVNKRKSFKLDESSLKSKLSKMIGFELENMPKNSSTSMKKNLKIEFVTNYYEFFIHLNLSDLNYFKELCYQQQTDSQCSFRDNEDEIGLEPLLVSSNFSIFYYFMDNNVPRKYLLNQVSIKYVLGYAKIRSSNIHLIEFDLASLSDSPYMSRLSTYSNDNDKTLTSNCSRDESAFKVSKCAGQSIDQLLPLSNVGNIGIDLNCFFVNNEKKENEEDEKLRVLYLKENQCQLKIDKATVNLDPKSSKKQALRLTFTKLIDQVSSPISLNELNIRLILQVKPNGFKFEMPIRFKQIKQIQTKSLTRKVESLASSKSILFFGKTLNSCINNDEGGLVNEFVIKNLNDFKCIYELSLVTCLNESTSVSSCYDEIVNISTNSNTSNLSEKSVARSSINLFKFTNEMKPHSRRDDPSMTRLIVELEGKQSLSISIKFNSSLFESDKSNQFLNHFGMVKISNLEFNQKFNIYLVGFVSKAQLCVDSNENKLIKKSDLPNLDSPAAFDPFKMERQICNRNLQIYSFNYQLSPNNYIHLNDEFSFVFKRTIKLHNKSSNSRITVYPIVFDCKENFELNFNGKTENDLTFDLELNNTGFNGKLRLVFERNKLIHSNDITWVDMAPNEVLSLSLDLDLTVDKAVRNNIVKNNITRKQLIEYYAKNDQKFDQLNVCLFWLEGDLNAQCLNGAQLLKNSSPKDQTLVENGLFVDSFLKRLLLSNIRLNQQTKPYIDSNYFVNSIITKKAKLQFENIVSLLRQSMKCSALKVSAVFRTLCEEFVSSTDQSSIQVNESTLSLNESKSIQQMPIEEPWSILNDSIVIHNVRFNSPTSNFSSKITIQNNLQKDLLFNLAFNSACLDIEPNRGYVRPLRTLDIIVRVRKEVANQLPWHSVISVICNKIDKDVKVSLYPPKPPNKMSNTSADQKIMRPPPPPPIQSQTLPVNSVSNRKNSNASVTSSSSLANTSSSYSASDSSAFGSLTASCSETLEQGTLVSETTQNSLDFIPLTPLMNADFKITATRLANQRSLLKPDVNDSIIRVIQNGNYSKIQFPTLCINKTKSYDFTIANPTNNYVTWRATLKPSTANDLTGDNLYKSTSGVFKLTPSSGLIQAAQKQVIKIEFNPREELGSFQELWEIDTKSLLPDSHKCKLVLSGKSKATDDDQDYGKILTQNILTESKSQRTAKSTTNLIKYRSKENCEPNNFFRKDESQNSKTFSEYDQTEYNNKSNLESENISRKIYIKTEVVQFPDTNPGSKSRSFIIIDNKEDKSCSLNILSLVEPFHCRHMSSKIDSMHYLKIPIDFKPRVPGDYIEKVIIRIENNEMPLSCIVKAKCVAAKI